MANPRAYLEYIEPEKEEAETRLPNQEGQAAEDTNFSVPRSPDELPTSIGNIRDSQDFIVPDPEPDLLPLKTKKQADQETFFAINEMGGDNIEEDKAVSTTQLLNTGKSDLVTKAEEQSELLDEEAAGLAIESVMSDPTIDPITKKSILTKYSRDGYYSTSLKEKYIHELAEPAPNLPANLKESQEIVKTQMPERILEHYDRILDADVKKEGVRGQISAFFESIDHVWDGAELQIRGGSKAEYDAGMIEFRKTQKEYALATGLGHIAALVVPAVPALLAGGVLVPIAAGGFIAAVIDGTSRFSELDYEGVDYATALKASLAQAFATQVDFAVPIIRAATIISRMMWNGGANVALGEMNVAMQNHILEAYPHLRQAQFDAKNMTINALMGIVIGSIFGGPARPFNFRMEDLDVPHNSIYETMNVANPVEARKIILENIKNDSTGNLTKEMAGGGDTSSVFKTYLFPNVDKPHPTDNVLDIEIRNEMNIAADRIEDAYVWGSQESFFDAFFGSPEKRYADLAPIYNLKRELIVKGNYLQANSYLDGVEINENVSKGTSLFGNTKSLPFPTELGAKRFLTTLEKRIERGTTPITSTLEVIPRGGGYVVKWDWKQLYEPINVSDTKIQKVELGIGPFQKDVTATSRKGWYSEIATTGRLNAQMENAALVNQERTRALFKNITKDLNAALLENKKYNRELDELINHVEINAHLRPQGDFYDMKTLSVMFPDLEVSGLERLHATHQIWRRVVKVDYLFHNREYRNNLSYKGMQPLWRIGKKEGEVDRIEGLVTKQLQPNDLTNLLANPERGAPMVWDYETAVSVQYNKEAFDAAGKIIVKLDKPIKKEIEGVIHSYKYGVVKEDGDLKFGYLPEFILPEIAGYSPRIVKENWFVDASPSKAFIDGKQVVGEAGLYTLKKTIAGVRTRADGNAFVIEYQKDHPNLLFTVRQERQDSIHDTASLMFLRKEEIDMAGRKGDPLPSYKGFARVEDRWVALLNSLRSISTVATQGSFGRAVRNAFIRDFGDMIPKHYVNDMPQQASELIPPVPDTKENKIRFQEAQAMFKWFQNLNQFEQWGDVIWNGWWHNAAKVAEEVIVPSHIKYVPSAISGVAHKGSKKIADYTSDKMHLLGRQGNIPAKWMTQFVAQNMISMNILRQLTIQPIQMLELYAVYPNMWKEAMQTNLSFRFALMSRARTLGPIEGLIMYHARQNSGLSDQEFDETMSWFEESGLLSGFDSQAYVNDLQNDTKNMLVENWQDTILKNIKKGVLVTPETFQKLGFDPAELWNRIGMLLMARHLWQKQNPKGDWRTIENKAIIAAEGLRLSGAMNKGGSYSYQNNWLKIFLQFQAIIQHQTMNVLQSTATIMDRAARSRLGMMRLSLYGLQYGIPAGYLIKMLYDSLTEESEPYISDPKWRTRVENGFLDPFANGALDIAVDIYNRAEGKKSSTGKSTVLMGKSMSPYSEFGLPHVAGIAELVKLYDGNPNSNPRFPSISMGSSLSKTINEIASWIHIKPITDPQLYEMVLREALETATIFGNMEKALVMRNTRKYLSTKGKSLGLPPTAGDIIYKGMFGGENLKQYKMYEASSSLMEHDKNVKAIAEKIYKGLQNIYTKLEDGEERKQNIESHLNKLSSFLTVVDPEYGSEDRDVMMDWFMKWDKQSESSIGESIIKSIFKNKTHATSKDFHEAIRHLQDIDNPMIGPLVEELEGIRNLETEPMYKHGGKRPIETEIFGSDKKGK